jgi:tryptophan-rich sensory protein
VKNFLGLVFWIALSFSAGFIGSFFMPGEWYRTLEKPELTPPGWVFGPVWTLLYIMMGTAAWLVWKRGGFATDLLPLSVFILQLILNALWTWIFFGNQRIGLALVDIVLLDIAIAAALVLFWKRAPAAGILLVPYLAWTLFATYLNFGFWRLNVPG